jgi:hypothetical protein
MRRHAARSAKLAIRFSPYLSVPVSPRLTVSLDMYFERVT